MNEKLAPFSIDVYVSTKTLDNPFKPHKSKLFQTEVSDRGKVGPYR